MSTADSSSDRAEWRHWYGEQVREFARRRPIHKRQAAVLLKVLQNNLGPMWPLAVMQARAKKVPNYAEKVIKRGTYVDPVNEMNDLCGGRVILHTKEEVSGACAWIRKAFVVHDELTQDVGERLAASEFGYRSYHFTVRFRPDFDYGVSVATDILELPNPWMEIQVRTFLQHTWADVAHDNIYKARVAVPDHLLRESARIAAALERLEDSFSLLVADLQVYQTNYLSYRSQEDLAADVGVLEEVHRQLQPEALGADPADDAFFDARASLAARIARLDVARGEWKRAVNGYEGLEKTGVKPSPAALRELGMVLCRLDDPASISRGRDCLEAAHAADPRDIDTCCELAQLARTADDLEGAVRWYSRAFEVAPDHPRVLSGYLVSRTLLERSDAIVPSMRRMLDDAARRAETWAEVQLHLPHAWLEQAVLATMAGDESAAARAGCSAIEFVRGAPAHVGVLRRWAEIVELLVELDRPNVDWWPLHRLLRVGLAVITPDAADALTPLRLPGRDAIESPITIVAGDSSSEREAWVARHAPAIEAGLSKLEGTLVSGGTNQGVSGIVGRVASAAHSRAKAIGYVPCTMPASYASDDYHEVRATSGSDFSIREPLQYWVDVLASGVSAREVRLIGFGGGSISSFEYRLATALGARVGLIRGSGRQADQLLREARRAGATNPIPLPCDSAVIATFGSFGARSNLERAAREKLARAAHSRYLAGFDSPPPIPPERSPWEELPDSLKASNRSQADHYSFLLSRIGAELSADESRPTHDLSAEDVEVLAATEHARWLVERLAAGWTLGKEKDLDTRTTPWLKPWADLPRAIQDRNRAVIQALPNILASAGFRITSRV